MSVKRTAAAVASIIALAPPGWAQQSPQDTTPQGEAAAPGRQREADELQLEEIVVTAQKRTESLQSVPLALSVVSGADLQRQHIFEASQLQYAIPSLQVESVNNQVGATNFFIRGIGTAIYGPAAESSVSTVIDDVVMARPSMGVVQFFDLDRLEVLRGPQGMLFGKNASAGVVNIVTATPRLGELETVDHLSYGKTNDASAGNELIAQGALNLPVSESSAARLSAFVTRQDGFARNVFQSENLGLTEYGARAKYLWQPGEAWQVYLSADYAHESGPGGSVLVRRFDAPGGFVATQDAGVAITASPRNLYIAGNAATFNEFELGGTSAKATYSFADGYSLTNITAYRAYWDRSGLDTDLLPISFFDGNTQRRQQKEISDELRFTSPAGGRLEYQLGLYYLYVRDYGSEVQSANLEPLFPPPPAGLLGNFGIIGSSVIRNNNYAAYGQSTFALTHFLRLITGGRWTRDDIRASGTADGAAFLVPLQPSFSTTGGFTKTNFSYKVGFESDVAENVLAYATFARGYKSPTFGGATGLEPIRPEIPLDAEVGLKSTLLERRLVLDVALFHTRFEDFQAQAYDPALLHFTTTNAGVLLAKGVELDVKALPAKGFSLSGGMTFNDAIYQSFHGDACYLGEPAGVSGRGVCLPNGTSDSTGNQLALAPRWVGSLTADFEHPLTSRVDGFVTTTYYYRSGISYTAAHDPRTLVGGYGILGGSIGLQSHDGRFRGALFVRNLTDKRVPTFVVADPVAPLYGDAIRGGDYLQQFDVSSFRTVGLSFDLQL
jgi:iron complex outermembrane recepter protein